MLTLLLEKLCRRTAATPTTWNMRRTWNMREGQEVINSGLYKISYPWWKYFSEIISDCLIFQFSEKFWEIFQISSESSRLSLKITEWETKNSRKIGETLHLKNSVKNLIFSAKTFYLIESSRTENTKILIKSKELKNWKILKESHICLLDKIINTTISTDKTYFKN